jgi:hypothetical protein
MIFTSTQKTKNDFYKSLVAYVVVVSVSMSLVFLVTFKHDDDYQRALRHYHEQSQEKATLAAKNVGDAFAQIYQGIRTISMLPSVKNIDRYGKNLDANAWESITQIYRNMASNVAVSEVYIVPVDLDPEQLDPTTGGLQEPILMFDGSDLKAESAEEANPPITTVSQALLAGEVEIHEYRLLKEQMTYLKDHYAHQSLVDKLNLPFIGGHGVLTCDNTEFKTTKIDADRTGIVLSVPFFAPNGTLKGTITAVIRNNIIRDMLPASDYALVNTAYNYVVTSKQNAQLEKSEMWVQQNRPDPSLLFSTTVPIQTTDTRSAWSLWVGHPDALFLQSDDAKTLKNFKAAGYGVSILLTVLGSIIIAILQRSKRSIQKIADVFERSVKHVVSDVTDSIAHMQSHAQSVTQIAADTKRRSASVRTLSQEASQASSQVAYAAEQLTTSIKEISVQTQRSSHIASEAAATAKDAKRVIESLAEQSKNVSQIIDVITNIASHINLLALNATIESARAGEAGKGFAVVASEVKDLATQVSKAAEQISTQINKMQAASASSVDSVMRIGDIIGQVSESTSLVAAAVEEQSAVTNEIASNIAHASSGTQEISDNIESVRQSAEQAGNTGEHVFESVRELNKQANALQQKVDDFLQSIRTA